WQYESRGLAAAGLRGHPQVAPLERRRNGRSLHRGRLDEFEFGDCLEQAFVQGELVKQGALPQASLETGGKTLHRLTRLPRKGASSLPIAAQQPAPLRYYPASAPHLGKSLPAVEPNSFGY